MRSRRFVFMSLFSLSLPFCLNADHVETPNEQTPLRGIGIDFCSTKHFPVLSATLTESPRWSKREPKDAVVRRI
uniref:Putative secreted protein n=1 Tax=Anopheles darlingi TaxID=43151 RepID=A0A2M4DDC5_ANODA